MSWQVCNSLFLTIYLLCLEFVTTNSRTSNMWKLNTEETKIVEANSAQRVLSMPENKNKQLVVEEDDPIFNIITSTVHFGQSWVKQPIEYCCTNCDNAQNTKKNFSSNNTVLSDKEDVLDCGKPVNFTYYDTLVGISNRHQHPMVLEPQVALIFKSKKTDKSIDFDVDALERRLRKAKKEKPKSVSLYSQIGNFWRIKGDPQKAIECFRRALSMSPHNAEVLLNLARVLFTLQYLDDAIYLTRRSMEVQPPDKGAWQQHFTLGEIYKAYGHYSEAIMHLRLTLELKPGFEPARVALKELEKEPEEAVHTYTMVIIICLVVGVLLVIISSFDTPNGHNCSELKPHRHFNKAMAMRSLRGLGMSARGSRSKKLVT